MRALLCEGFDSDPDHLRLVDLPDPTPGPGEVVIKVRAAGLNFADLLMIAGRYQDTPPPPFVPGLECAGEVVAVGEGVAGPALGARVVATVAQGALAERVCARAAQVHPIPDAMPFETAAGFVIAYGTSHYGLVERARLGAGEWLLVTGAAGGVGLTAVEVGKRLGARVIAVAGGAEKCAVAAEAGAEAVIDYQTEDIRERAKAITGGHGIDVFYDAVGGASFEAGFRAMARGGRILLVGFASGQVPQLPANIMLVKNLTAIGYYWGAYRAVDPDGIRHSIETLLDWYAGGTLRPHVSATFPLDRATAALAALKSRASTGKVVVTMAG